MASIGILALTWSCHMTSGHLWFHHSGPQCPHQVLCGGCLSSGSLPDWLLLIIRKTVPLITPHPPLLWGPTPHPPLFPLCYPAYFSQSTIVFSQNTCLLRAPFSLGLTSGCWGHNGELQVPPWGLHYPILLYFVLFHFFCELYAQCGA